ncbi:MAG: T9SS type A sorting domain-containing protein [Lewinellaceae bacterium]|nr:T9SS type A sorting domain-containing protein [Phaeodactylibacter sp.]MCB9035105.1 T9SS type A sorting domain-containing protein [Lewinellaceae bacterium]
MKKCCICYLSLWMLMAIFPLAAFGQGWKKALETGSAPMFPTVAIATEDGGYAIGGGWQKPLSSFDGFMLVKTDSLGQVQWRRQYERPGERILFANLLERAGGGFLMLGMDASFSGLRILQTDAAGNEMGWQALDIGVNLSPQVAAVTAAGTFLYVDLPAGNGSARILEVGASGLINPTPILLDSLPYRKLSSALSLPDGFLITGGNNVLADSLGQELADLFVAKIGFDGQPQWERTYHLEGNTVGIEIIPTADGNYLLNSNSAFPESMRLTKISPDGLLLWSQAYLGDFSLDFGIASRRLAELANGDYAIIGQRYDPLRRRPIAVLHVTGPDGQLKRTHQFSHGLPLPDPPLAWGNLHGSSVQPIGNGILFSASSAAFFDASQPGDTTAYFLLGRTDSLGNFSSNLLRGQVLWDEQGDCQPGNDTLGLSGWVVEVEGASSALGLTGPGGFFEIPLDTGAYTARVLGNAYWESCQGEAPFGFTSGYDTLELDFPVRAEVDCPLLEVSLSAPFLRRCFENTYFVRYCNWGTTPAEAAYVEVEFDPHIQVLSSSVPWSSVSGQTYTFPLGDIGVGACGAFEVQVYLDCDSTILGQTHCSSAHIYPDSFCLPPDPLWSGASIEVTGRCEQDSVRFQIRNVGSGDMAVPRNYFVIEDDIIMMESPFQLNAGEVARVLLLANGSAYRLEAEQAPGHPGNSKPSASVVDCGGYSPPGFITQFEENDGDPFVSIDCQPNIGSFDPNDKQGYPQGFGTDRLIHPNTDIEYHIRFQNTGTDTAFRVVIEDRISSHLDLTTFRAGASSHPYAVDIKEPDLLTFTFSPIQLPDSATNEPASHGFVRFRISQQPNLADNTVIRNTAGIYFDFNEPVITNTTSHRVKRGFPDVQILGLEPGPEAFPVKVYPNPFDGWATLELEGWAGKALHLQLFDSQGRQVLQQRSLSGSFNIRREQLPGGIFFFRLLQNGRLLGSGRLIAR